MDLLQNVQMGLAVPVTGSPTQALNAINAGNGNESPQMYPQPTVSGQTVSFPSDQTPFSDSGPNSPASSNAMSPSGSFTWNAQLDEYLPQADINTADFNFSLLMNFSAMGQDQLPQVYV